jgi:predicted dehydrogenase
MMLMTSWPNRIEESMAESSEPIRVGLVGYGFSGKTFHAPLIGAVSGLSLISVCSRDSAKVLADLPHVEVIADPLALATSSAVDLVVIASPNDSHVPLARAALRAQKHVIVDKPFTLTLADARELGALAETQQRLLSVFHNRRWDSDFLSIRQAITEGVIGTVAHFESHFDRFRPEVRRRWREGSGPGSGIWFDLGPHLVDQAIQLFGTPARVSANLALQRQGALSDDWAHVVLEYGPRRVILHAGMLVAGGVPRFLVHGNEGSLMKRKSDPQEAQLLAGMKPRAEGWGVDPDAVILYDGNGGERLIPALAGDQSQYYAGIHAALRTSAPNPVTPLQAIAVVAVIEAAVLSAQTGKAIAPDLSDDERVTLACSIPALG